MQIKPMTFSEAETRFWRIKGMRSTRHMDRSTFEAALRELMVQDQNGRWWMPHQETGQWHVYNGSTWVPGAPPAAAFPAPAQPAAVRPTPVSSALAPGPASSAGLVAAPGAGAGTAPGGGMGMTTALLIAVVFWGVVAIAVAVFVAPEGALGVGAAALLSIVLMLRTYQDSWEGVVERVETRRVRIDRGNEDPRWADQQFAVIRLTSGKAKDLRPMPDWRVGDRLVKRRGETGVRKLNS